ncbi:hypothetical protein [Helicobacter sp. T3_23-1056]
MKLQKANLKVFAIGFFSCVAILLIAFLALCIYEIFQDSQYDKYKVEKFKNFEALQSGMDDRLAEYTRMKNFFVEKTDSLSSHIKARPDVFYGLEIKYNKAIKLIDNLIYVSNQTKSYNDTNLKEHADYIKCKESGKKDEKCLVSVKKDILDTYNDLQEDLIRNANMYDFHLKMVNDELFKEVIDWEGLKKYLN